MTSVGGDPDPSDEALETWMQRYMRRQRDAVEHADETGGPGEAESALRKHLLGQTGDSTPTSREAGSSGVSWLRLAAALILVGLSASWYFGGFHSSTSDVILGAGDLRALEPVGQVNSFDLFRWEGTTPQGGFVRVFVSPGDGRALVESPELDGSTWEPSEADVRGWSTIEWWVESFAGSNQPMSESRSASVVATTR